MNIKCPKQNSCKINVVTDMGAQLCLWDLDSYLKHGFKKILSLTSQNKDGSSQQTKITGGIFMELMAKDEKGKCHIAKVMVYDIYDPWH